MKLNHKKYDAEAGAENRKEYSVHLSDVSILRLVSNVWKK